MYGPEDAAANIDLNHRTFCGEYLTLRRMWLIISAEDAVNMKYIHERAGWPDLTWDSELLTSPLAAMRHKQGRLLGKMESLGFTLRTEAGLATLTTDVVKTSAIEGETLNPDEVRSSLARRLGLNIAGLPAAGRDVEAIVEVMLDATQRFDAPLTRDRLFGWHAALFSTARSGMARMAIGAWRTGEFGPMQVVSGPLGRETVHFEAPTPERLDTEMSKFLEWFNTSSPSLDPVLKAAIAHFWFVTIHPFDDGNGRIARAIADMALAHADGASQRFYSMSSQIESERRQYYLRLESSQRGGLDITLWLEWFVGCLDRAIDSADTTLAAVLRKARVWQAVNRGKVNERQRLVINRLLDNFKGHLTTSKYATFAKCSTDTALRDIHELIERGILVQNPGGGRSTSYSIAKPE